MGYSEAIETFYVGESVKRTGIATVPFVDDDGKEYIFARVEYTVEGNTVVYYVNNAYLSTEEPIENNPDGEVVFEDVNVNILIKTGNYYIRKSTIYTDDQRLSIVPEGTVLHAIGVGTEESDGTVWYKIEYEDRICYIIFKSEGMEIQAQ